jgi:hypothetical protein
MEGVGRSNFNLLKALYCKTVYPTHQCSYAVSWYVLSICDIWQITFRLMMAKYLAMLPKDETVQ